MALPVRELKGMLKDRNIDMTGAGARVLYCCLLTCSRPHAAALPLYTGCYAAGFGCAWHTIGVGAKG